MKSEVLFIVEGESSEPELINLINTKLNIDNNLNTNIYSYGTSIYELYEELKMDEYLDIALHLRSKETNKRKRELLSKKFQAIYLIFDFEPHYQKFDIDKIIEMNDFFNNSLERGLLLINYPMLESYKHISKMPDKEFLYRTITRDEARKYKEVVGKESFYTDISLYNRRMIMEQIIHHLIKLNYLIKGNKAMPNHEEVEELINDNNFIKQQFFDYKKDLLNVVSTVYYYLLELKPKTFYDELMLPITDDLCND